MDISIPGLRAVVAITAECIQAESRRMQQAGIIIPVTGIPRAMHHFGTSSFQCTDWQGNDPVATLEFSSAVLISRLHRAFIFEDRHSNRYLIGSAEPPFPKVEITKEIENMTRCFRYKITWHGQPALCLMRMPYDSSKQFS